MIYRSQAGRLTAQASFASLSRQYAKAAGETAIFYLAW